MAGWSLAETVVEHVVSAVQGWTPVLRLVVGTMLVVPLAAWHLGPRIAEIERCSGASTTRRHQQIIALWRAHRIVSDAWWWRWWAHPQRFALASAGLHTIDAIDAAMAQHTHTPGRRLGDAGSPGPDDRRLHGGSRPGRRPPLRATATSRNVAS